MEAHFHEEPKLWSFIVLCQKQINNARRENKERNLTWRSSRGQKLLDTFRALTRVHFMHNICCFEAQEVRSPTLQMVHELELKRRSYGHLKTTVQSWVEISQPKAHFATLAHKCHFAAHASIFAAANHVVKSPSSCETSCKSSPSCRIISKLWNHLQVEKPKFKLAKWIIQHVNHLANSTCLNSDICNRLS